MKNAGDAFSEGQWKLIISFVIPSKLSGLRLKEPDSEEKHVRRKVSPDTLPYILPVPFIYTSWGAVKVSFDMEMQTEQVHIDSRLLMLLEGNEVLSQHNTE